MKILKKVKITIDFFEESFYNNKAMCRCDGIGRRTGLKIPRWRHRAGSTPATGTKKAPVSTGAFLFSSVGEWLATPKIAL